MTKKIFRFISSIRLAVPLMLVILVVIAYGTIVESRYNADMAKLQVYSAPWFSGLMVLLWLNIFTSTISRWPFQKKHIGFVTVHAGLLTLLIGGMVTGIWGIDGTLRLTEGEKGGTVVLQDLVLNLSPVESKTGIDYPLPRTMKALDAADLEDLNSQIGSLFKVSRMEPFVEIKTLIKKSSGPPAEPLMVSFRLKSAFFDVEQTLQSQDQNQLQMGPATFRLIKSDAAPAKTRAKISTSSPNVLIIKDRKTGSELKKIPASSLRAGSKLVLNLAGSIEIEVVKVLRNAVVGRKGGVRDDEEKMGQENPALELKISKAGDSVRDVIYARFPNFSLNHKDDFGLAFEYHAETAAPTAAPPTATEVGAGGNEVQFRYSLKTPDSLTMVLLKNGKKLQESVLKEGGLLQTPWMGIQLTLNQISWGGESVRQVVATQPGFKQPTLPPSAIHIIPKDAAPADETWLTEGDQIQATLNDRNYVIYFGRRMLDLPFQIELRKFSKKDYPGTNTAKSFESQIFIPDLNREQIISMNEPLVHSGYTVYQASYEQLPNGQFASIFSVNKDPGRPLKYLGGLVLSLGIIIFTLMRTQWYRKRWGL